MAMLATLGGERREVNERDLFLACWHAFPNAMRWADTALPNPDTFTASLRRLDADGIISRIGKQARAKRKKAPRRGVLEVGRSGVVKARINEGGLEKAGLRTEDLESVRRLVPEPDRYRGIDPAILVAICIAAREEEGRATDEGALVETAFHKFPAVFAYRDRPEFPDVGAVRAAAAEARARGLQSDGFALAPSGRQEVDKYKAHLEVRVDASESFKTGAFRLAERIEKSPAYQSFRNTRSLSETKGDELFRALRLPPTTDRHRIAAALHTRARELRRIDKGEVVEYLVKVAERHNPDVLELLAHEEPLGVGDVPSKAEGTR